MGTNKALIVYRGKELYRYSLEKLEKLCDEIIISSNNPDYTHLPYSCYPDDIKDIGPLGGIFTCLTRISNPYALVLSCDMPFIPYEYLEFLQRNAHDAAVVCGVNQHGMPEPLAGVYSKNVVPAINALILKGEYRMSALFKQAGARLIPLQGSPFQDIGIFKNINTPEDLSDLLECI